MLLECFRSVLSDLLSRSKCLVKLQERRFGGRTAFQLFEELIDENGGRFNACIATMASYRVELQFISFRQNDQLVDTHLVRSVTDGDDAVVVPLSENILL